MNNYKSGGDFVGGNSVLAHRSLDLAILIVEYYKWIVAHEKEFVMSKQLLRSGTSVGANIHEAYYAVSRPDFIAKMQIALKECSETEYWLLLLEKTGYANENIESIKIMNTSLKKMLISTLKTAKDTQQK